MKYNNRLSKTFFILLLCFSCNSNALELGMTPSHVHAIWLNINKLFLEIQKESKIPHKQFDTILSIEAVTFHGKTPSDVFPKANALSKATADLFEQNQNNPSNIWINHYQRLEEVTESRLTTPSQVYLESYQLLRILIEEYVKITNQQKPISQFFKHIQKADIDKMTPSDVYSQVDLYQRRLNEFKNQNTHQSHLIKELSK